MLRLPTLTISIFLSFYLHANAESIAKIEAFVGKKVITTYDVENLDVHTYKTILATENEALRQAQIEAYKKEALNFLISQAIMESAAEKENVSVSEDEINMAIEGILNDTHISRKQLDEKLKKDGLSFEKYRLQIKSQIISAKVRSQILLPKIVITEEDIRSMVDKRSNDLSLNHFSNLQVLKVHKKTDIKKLEKEILAIKEIGERELKFTELVRKYSVDPSAKDDGMLGWTNLTYVPAELERAVIKLKVGELSPIYKEDGLYCLALVHGVRNKYDIDNKTREILTEAIAEEQFQKIFQRWLGRHKDTIPIIIPADNPLFELNKK